MHTEEALRLVRDLNFGAQIGPGSVSPIDQQRVFEQYKNRATNKLQAERVRCGDLPVISSSYVTEAHNRRRKHDG